MARKWMSDITLSATPRSGPPPYFQGVATDEVAVLEEEERQDGNDHDINQIAGHREKFHAGSREGVHNIAAARGPLLADVGDYLGFERVDRLRRESRGLLVLRHHFGKLEGQGLSLGLHARTNLNADEHYSANKDHVSQRQRQRARALPRERAIEQVDQRRKQVGEQQRQREYKERGAQEVDKVDEQEHYRCSPGVTRRRTFDP